MYSLLFIVVAAAVVAAAAAAVHAVHVVIVCLFSCLLSLLLMIVRQHGVSFHDRIFISQCKTDMNKNSFSRTSFVSL